MKNIRELAGRLAGATALLAVILSLQFSAYMASPASGAATITVNSTADKLSTDGFCTLREAIIAANKDLASSSGAGECPAGSGADTIILPAGVYTLTRSGYGSEDSSSTGDLDIRSDITINTTGAVTITAATGFSDRIFHIISGTVVISNVTISNGNGSYGGAIYNAGNLTLANSTLTNNKSSGWGGAIKNTGTLALTNVTLSGNTAKTDGGGLYNYSGTATLTNVTIANNTADSDANGSGNGGGIARYNGTINIKNTLIGGNLDKSASTKRPDCSGSIASQGYNLIQNTTGCSITGTTTGNLLNVNPNIGLLLNNGGSTFTHALLDSPTLSPAIEAGTNTGCPATDQRDISRPQGLTCDIGAYEFENPPQVGPVFVVNTADDPGDGVCGYSHCSLREAINAANARPNGASPDQITFNIAGAGPHTIAPASALPAITDPVIIDGTTDAVVLDGLNAGAGVDGLTLNTSNSTVRNLTIARFGGNGVLVTGGAGNALRANSIFDNGGLGIDLGGDGVTPNDTADADSGANNLQNFPVVTRAVPNGGNITIEGRLNSAASTTFTLEFFASPTCDSSGSGEGQTFLGATTATTDATGDANFTATLAATVAPGQHVTATATDPNGNTSEFSQCAVAGPGNDAWTRAQTLALGGDPLSASADQFLDKSGQSRWYKFSVQPGSKVIVTLTNLPANYDLTLYKDIAAAYQTITSPQDLVRLGAEFAPDTFSPDTFSPDTFSPDTFSPDTFSPDTFSPDTFSPDTFSPDTFSPDTFSPDTFSPDTFSPDTFSPDTFSPDTFSPDTFSPDPAAFSSAQTRSLIGVSAFEGTSGEGISLNTWNNSGDFYVRVRGRNGAFDLTAPFHLQVIMLAGSCNTVTPTPSLPANPQFITPSAGNYKTVILADFSRMPSTPALDSALAAFAARPEVAGVVVNVGNDDLVKALNTQADSKFDCPYAKNLVAGAIKDIVDGYWNLNPLEYVVIIGGDNVIPFFRYPDQALLANEQNYVPPVKDSTASQASLKLGYVLSQDGYGAPFDLSLKVNAFPLPGLAVGRLVETADEATTMLNAYLGTSNGVAPQPTSSLVTGYDFLEDAANAVQNELAAGLGPSATTDSLIAPRNISPTDPASWTAAQLETALLGSRHDLIYLAGHFSAGSTLAADYTTRLLTTDVTASSVNLTNSIIFSAGCHAGYNIVNEHGVSGVTAEPDWAQAFARKGATLIAGTGYQYGDTDFIEYSERLYLEFSRQLRTGSGPVSVGKALAAAKQAYLAGTPQMRGIHEKAYLEATLFGLPMLSVDMPGARLPAGDEASIITTTNTFAANPGLTLGLQYADVNVTSPLNPHTVTLKDPANPLQTVTATYLSGNDGVLANPAEPVLPLELRNVTVANLVLRGVGFRGGAYSDQFNVLPLTGAATTEIRGIHAPAFYDVFYPIRPWNVNYFDALVAGGATRLAVTPAQFVTDPDSLTGAGTLRQFSSMGFRLYYSNNTQTYSGNVPALSEPLSITSISAEVSGATMNFSARVTGEPAAGVQEVWVTYTALDGPFAGTWQSLDLTRSGTDSTLWQGSLDITGTLPEDVRFMVQAANGVGLVTLMTNLGQYYSVNLAPTEPTALVLETPTSTSGAYRTSATFSAVLTNNGTPLPGQRVIFSLGGQRRRAITDVNGRATVTMLLNGLPGDYDLRASFLGNADYQPSFAGPLTFTITKQATTLTLTPPTATSHLGNGVLTVATLTDAAGNHLAEETVFFVITGESGSFSTAVITDFAGQAALEDVNLPDVNLPFDSYTVTAYFSGTIIPGTLVLDDARYTPATATGSLALINNTPSAGDDAYSMDENGSLTVAAPGVLTNDDDADDDALTAILVDAPAHGTVTLNADGSFTYTPTPGFSGADTFTYKANDGFTDSNLATVTITVSPVDNLIYGAQNEDDSVQFFTVDPNTHEVNPLGPVQTGFDIEGIDLHPASGALYATSENGGRLYIVDKETGLLTLIGSTGFNNVPGLSFKHDGTLWGWAKGKGLITINLSTGQGTLVFASNSLLTKNVEGIAWSNDGALLYMVANRDLLVYNPANNTVTKIAGNLPGKAEAADMRPDGLLALGVHGYTIFAYDVNLKQIVAGESITTPYDDVEGLAWPN